MRTPLLLVSFAVLVLVANPPFIAAQGSCDKQFVVSQVNLPTTTHLSPSDQAVTRARLIGDCFDDQQFSELVGRIRNTLRDLGYFRATVSEPSISIDDAGRHPQAASLNANFEEGARYRVEAIDIRGNRGLSADQIRGLSPIQLGEFFDSKKVAETERAVRKLYEANGYSKMSLHSEIREMEGRAHAVFVIFTVVEGVRSD
jgi:outer membrane protein assembly factor BamA